MSYQEFTSGYVHHYDIIIVKVTSTSMYIAVAVSGSTWFQVWLLSLTVIIVSNGNTFVGSQIVSMHWM